MSTAAQSSIYTSLPFKFIIDGNPLYIHAELVSRNSRPLNRMINGHMAEAQKGFAIIEDVGDDTFVRFIQWAYNGYYDAAKYVLDLESPNSSDNEKNDTNVVVNEPAKFPFDLSVEPEAEPAVEPAAEWFLDRKKSSKKVKKVSYEVPVPYADASTTQSSKEYLKESFIKRKEIFRKYSISLPQPRENQAPNEDYTEVFLSHARLYVFAEKYDIRPLKALALEELQAMLAIFNLHNERTGDIIALLRYVYENTGESTEGVEDIRTLMTHYVGYEMDTLMKDDGFRDLMIEDGGALLGDFMRMVGKRIF
ncbi:hypothetical protein OEA41_009742 [Lepraria neglecta]|uniref:BTB domain-containing protein n=1 Tax=Lepraria neglecta TaxID=209136 RepID=A0AAD9Z2T8_9LECA|nr:hypothetical protein OEA41_009742 [Lepraria neglecta]